MAWFTNQFGSRVWLDHAAIELIKSRGDLDKFHKRTFTTAGTGPANRIAVIFESPNAADGSNGIGDYIHSMPAIASHVAAGVEVHVWTGEFFRFFVEAAGGVWHNARDLGIGSFAQLALEYASVHSLVHWCIEHDEQTFGVPTTPRFEQIADFIGAKLPESYSWRDAFGMPANQLVSPLVIVALQSTSRERSFQDARRPIPETRQQIADATGMECIVLGGGNAHKEPWMFTAGSAQDLIQVIASAAVVVSVDNGILAIALALGVPVVAVFGPTDEYTIVWQFAQFVDCSNVRVITSQTFTDECTAPCSLQPERGFGVNLKCMRDRSAMVDCYQSIPQHAITESVIELLSSLNL
jgi:hypothetical protein